MKRRWRSGAPWIDTEKVGHTLRRLSRLSWFLGRNAEAERYATAGGGGAGDPAAGSRAGHGIRLPGASGHAADDERRCARSGASAPSRWPSGWAITRPSATRSTAWARRRWPAAIEQGRAKLERSLAIALEHGYEEHAARAYANLAIYSDRHAASMPQAEATYDEGIAYCAERDLDPWGHFLRWVAGARASRSGRLGRGGGRRHRHPERPLDGGHQSRIPALLVLGRVRARRGDPGAEAALDEARDLALAIGEPQRIEPVAAARAEWRWLQGDLRRMRGRGQRGFHPAIPDRPSWYQGEVVIWLWRGGGLTRSAARTCPRPTRLQIAGDWRAAADAWEQIGCPWEQALALLDGDEAAQRAALAIFERLGATPAAEIARRRLRGAGARGLPVDPAQRHRRIPHGLTNRAIRDLLLLAEGCTTPRSPSGSRPPPRQSSTMSPLSWPSSTRARAPRPSAAPMKRA